MSFTVLNATRHCKNIAISGSIVKHSPLYRTMFTNSRMTFCNNSLIVTKRYPFLLQEIFNQKRYVELQHANDIQRKTPKKYKFNYERHNIGENKIMWRWMYSMLIGMFLVPVIFARMVGLNTMDLITATSHLLTLKMPDTEEEWMERYKRYKDSPVYEFIRKEMDLEEFKFMLWMGYTERAWSAFIGITFVLSAFYLIHKGMLNRQKRLAVFGMFALLCVENYLFVKTANNRLKSAPSKSAVIA